MSRVPRSTQARALAWVLGLHLLTEAAPGLRPRSPLRPPAETPMRFMYQPPSVAHIDEELEQYSEALLHCPVEPMLSKVLREADDALDARNAVRPPRRLPIEEYA